MSSPQQKAVPNVARQNISTHLKELFECFRKYENDINQHRAFFCNLMMSKARFWEPLLQALLNCHVEVYFEKLGDYWLPAFTNESVEQLTIFFVDKLFATKTSADDESDDESMEVDEDSAGADEDSADEDSVQGVQQCQIFAEGHLTERGKSFHGLMTAIINSVGPLITKETNVETIVTVFKTALEKMNEISKFICVLKDLIFTVDGEKWFREVEVPDPHSTCDVRVEYMSAPLGLSSLCRWFELCLAFAYCDDIRHGADGDVRARTMKAFPEQDQLVIQRGLYALLLVVYASIKALSIVLTEHLTNAPQAINSAIPFTEEDLKELNNLLDTWKKTPEKTPETEKMPVWCEFWVNQLGERSLDVNPDYRDHITDLLGLMESKLTEWSQKIVAEPGLSTALGIAELPLLPTCSGMLYAPEDARVVTAAQLRQLRNDVGDQQLDDPKIVEALYHLAIVIAHKKGFLNAVYRNSWIALVKCEEGKCPLNNSLCKLGICLASRRTPFPLYVQCGREATMSMSCNSEGQHPCKLSIKCCDICQPHGPVDFRLSKRDQNVQFIEQPTLRGRYQTEGKKTQFVAYKHPIGGSEVSEVQLRPLAVSSVECDTEPCEKTCRDCDIAKRVLKMLPDLKKRGRLGPQCAHVKNSMTDSDRDAMLLKYHTVNSNGTKLQRGKTTNPFEQPQLPGQNYTPMHRFRSGKGDPNPLERAKFFEDAMKTVQIEYNNFQRTLHDFKHEPSERNKANAGEAAGSVLELIGETATSAAFVARNMIK